ncbi:MAG: hypothetical protein M1830_005602 [Pleopsidium flavum]|nr:MAG: hypothetical protein M1830_005602 [Pleopsidium flavum]
MQFSLASALALSAILGFAAASPGPVPEDFSLDNGKETVTVSTGGPVRLFERDNNINCKGSAFCERLGGSCDDALRKVQPANTYGTYTGASNTGTCSGTCGLFVSGDHCTVTGQDLIDAYNAIRDQGHCTHCGQFQRSDGCTIKIDRVTGCN